MALVWLLATAHAATAADTGAGPASTRNAAAAAAQAWHARNAERYRRSYGLNVLGVRAVSSGYMLKFSYEVTDPDKAKAIFDQKLVPYLIDQRSGARLGVPALENVGELRQVGTPVANRTYFVIFGNPGKRVQPGNEVSIVIGSFRADGVIVE